MQDIRRLHGDEDTHGAATKLTGESVEAVRQIAGARTSYDIFKILKNYLPAFGLDYFIVFVSRDDGETKLDDRVVLTNWDSEVIHRCMDEDYYHWSFVQELRNSVLPEVKSLTRYLENGDEADNPELGKFLLARGYNAFVHLPARSSIGRVGMISFAGQRDDVGIGEMMQLNFVAEHAFERLIRIVGDVDARENPLSEREIECLKAAARGLSVAETSEGVGITTHTVNYHLANAQKKLEARNKLQAVVNAIQHGWLGKY